MTIPNDWGVPDWLDASAYPQPTGRARMLVWAWEFLRRNPDYRTFWAERVARHVDADGFVSNEAGPVMREAKERFGTLIFPSHPASSKYPFFMATAVRQIFSGDVTLKPNETSYVFDLTSPLEGQFARALNDAKEIQKRRVKQGKFKFRDPKERCDKYTIYLRIIDAEDAGINQSEIAGILFPTFTNEHPEYQRTQTFKNHRKAALRLRDNDFRLLASLAVARGNAK